MSVSINYEKIEYDNLLLSICRINVVFINNTGHSKPGTGTGFWIFHKNMPIFVTNRHLLDFNFSHKEDPYKTKLDAFSIWLRTATQEKNIKDLPTKREVDLKKTKIIHHDTADLSILYNINFCENDTKPGIHVITEVASTLADATFFSNALQLLNPCVFVGYPYTDSGKTPLYDTKLGIPIARLAHIASYPREDFSNGYINSSHVMLITGFSFGGSSGSPILTTGDLFGIHSPKKPMLVGVMAGHYSDCYDNRSKLLNHTGISYFVKSTAIWDLLNSI